jgi:hypothetical protein
VIIQVTPQKETIRALRMAASSSCQASCPSLPGSYFLVARAIMSLTLSFDRACLRPIASMLSATFLGVHSFERVHKITEFHIFDRLIGAFRVTYAQEVEKLSNSLPLGLFLHGTSPADHRCCTVSEPIGLVPALAPGSG